MKFIKVTAANEPCFINVEHITNVIQTSSMRVLIRTTDYGCFYVDQSLAEVMSQIEGKSL